MPRNRLIAAVLLAALAVAGGVAWWKLKPAAVAPLPSQADLREQQLRREEVERIARADAGAATRTDIVRPTQPTDGPAGGNPKKIQEPAGYGTLQPISATATPQTKAAVEAALAKNHPERLTSAILPAPFDAKKWVEDADYRQQYLATPEPGRCYQSAQPAQGVRRIALACPAYIETLQGQPVELRVRATPGMPVTFTSFDAAQFVDTKVTTQTVVADKDGIASVQLLPTPGVIAESRVRASCPVDAGVALITVFVKLPAEAAK